MTFSEPVRSPEASARPVLPVRVDLTGRAGPTRGQARGPHWRQTSYGFYVPSHVDGSRPIQRVAEQSVRLPPGGAVTGWAAGLLLGASYLDGLEPDGITPLPVPLAIGSSGNIRGDAAVLLLRGVLRPEEVVTVLGIPCVIPERAAFDAMRTASSLIEAVVAIEMFALGEVTSPRRTRAYVDSVGPWRRGTERGRAALDLASEHSWSPSESRMHMVWRLEAGLPPPLLNQPLFDRQGRLLCYPDLLDVEAGLVGEYDGAHHRGPGRHSKDVGREDLLRRHGLEVFRVTGPDLRSPGRVKERMLEARSRAKFLPEAERRWTTTPPPGWEPGPTLDERLDERDLKRQLERQWQAESSMDIPS
jgi:very-short-patch-repair endonuclease